MGKKKDEKTSEKCVEASDWAFRIGRFRINIGRLPELLLLFVIAWMVAYIAMDSYQMSRQMAMITGLLGLEMR